MCAASPGPMRLIVMPIRFRLASAFSSLGSTTSRSLMKTRLRGISGEVALPPGHLTLCAAFYTRSALRANAHPYPVRHPLRTLLPLHRASRSTITRCPNPTRFSTIPTALLALFPSVPLRCRRCAAAPAPSRCRVRYFPLCTSLPSAATLLAQGRTHPTPHFALLLRARLPFAMTLLAQGRTQPTWSSLCELQAKPAVLPGTLHSALGTPITYRSTARTRTDVAASGSRRSRTCASTQSTRRARPR
jgi:hypothetical protein